MSVFCIPLMARRSAAACFTPVSQSQFRRGASRAQVLRTDHPYVQPSDPYDHPSTTLSWLAGSKTRIRVPGAHDISD